jgi:RNA polymerase sigma-70 factor (ECF subfamily)
VTVAPSDHALGLRPLEATVAEPPLELIYREHGPRFLRVAHAILHDEASAEDVVQDAFAVAILRQRSYRGSGDAVAWVWRIVVNTALSRRRRRRMEELLLHRGARPAETTETPADGERVRRCVARLPGRQKLALFLHYYADLDYDAIARVLEISPGTVGKLLWDARTTLRGMLDE